MKLAAAGAIAARTGLDAQAVARAYQFNMSGHQLACELELVLGVHLKPQDVEALGDMGSLVAQELDKAVREWVLENQLTPMYVTRTRLFQGVIIDVYPGTAQYRVEDQAGKIVLVNFEDALAV